MIPFDWEEIGPGDYKNNPRAGKRVVLPVAQAENMHKNAQMRTQTAFAEQTHLSPQEKENK
ncbi:MAG: hypothetical protein ABSH45_12540 [Bryobacteraceae bacterium]